MNTPDSAPRGQPVLSKTRSSPQTPGLAERHRFGLCEPVLPVADVQRAARYFCEVLGFALDFMAGEPPTHARVKRGVARADAASPRAGATIDRSSSVSLLLWQCGATQRPAWRGEFVIDVGHDLDGLHAAYLARGVSIVEPPLSQLWGSREFAIREPDGHLLRFRAPN